MGERDARRDHETGESSNDDERRLPILGLAGALLLLVMAMVFWVWPVSEQDGTGDGFEKRGPDWTVNFTQPEAGASVRGAAEQAVIGAIESAQDRIDLAVYSFSLRSVRDALLAAHDRGVQIRIVIESDNLGAAEVQELERAGIPIRSDERDHLMHHKFMVIDRHLVWTGSMNYTFSGARLENNSGILIESHELAANFEVEFDEMFVEDRFGQLSLRNTPYELIEVDDRVVEVLFAPEDRVTQRLVQLIRGARQEVQILAFIFTSDPIAEALAEQALVGIPVQMVLEAEHADAPGSDYLSLLEAGVDVRLDSNPYNMHHKVLIVDDRIVAVGSFNYTRSAQDFNDESVLIIHSPDMVSAYREEFKRVFNRALP